jgi:hypothetical protein
MSISASTIAQKLHATLHRAETQQTAPMQRRGQFQHHLQSAAQGLGKGTGSDQGSTGPGGLLSADMLKAMQTVG